MVQIRHRLQTRGHVNCLTAILTYTTRRHISQIRSHQNSESNGISQRQSDNQVLRIDAQKNMRDPIDIRTIERFMQFANKKLKEHRSELVASRLAEQPADHAEP